MPDGVWLGEGEELLAVDAGGGEGGGDVDPIRQKRQGCTFSTEMGENTIPSYGGSQGKQDTPSVHLDEIVRHLSRAAAAAAKHCLSTA